MEQLFADALFDEKGRLSLKCNSAYSVASFFIQLDSNENFNGKDVLFPNELSHGFLDVIKAWLENERKDLERLMREIIPRG